MPRSAVLIIIAALLTGCGVRTIGESATQPLVPTPTPTALEAEQQALGALLAQLGLPLSSGGSTDGTHIELYVTDQQLLTETLRQANATLPPHVVPVVVYEPLRAPPVALTPAPEIHFPQLRMRSSSYMTALLQGTLVVEDGCLRVRSETSSELIIWQTDFFLNNNAGTIEVINRDGEVVGRIGEPISMGGGGTPMTSELMRNLRAPLPEQCGGPYWLADVSARLGN